MATERRRGIRWAAAMGMAVVLLALVAWPTGPPEEGPMIVVSIDRTVWHRLGLTRFTYLRALSRAGGRSRVVNAESPGAGARPTDLAREVLADADGLLLTGGGDVDPELYRSDRRLGRGVKEHRDRYELALLEEAARRRMPLLAICRGMQLLNVARGGSLRDMRGDGELYRRHRRLRRGHGVVLAENSRLAEILGTNRLTSVFTYHGQAVERPGRGLRVSARAPDGVVEALEDELVPSGGPAPFVLAVQWHPELSPRSRQQRQLFAAFVEAARTYRGGRSAAVGGDG